MAPRPGPALVAQAAPASSSNQRGGSTFHFVQSLPRRPSRRHARVAVLWAAALALPPLAVAGPTSPGYALPSSTLNAGIGAMASPGYKVSSSVGDPLFTGSSASPGYRLARGLWIAEPGATPLLVSAASRRQHGTAGDFDLPLALTPTSPTVEPRQGPTATVVFTFDRAITGATVAVTGGTAVAAAPAFNGSEVVVGLTGVANAQYVTLALTGVAAADGGSGGSAAVRIGFLLGDVNGSRSVTLADVLGVNAALAQLVTAATYLRDVNASGTLSLSDKLLVNTNLTQVLPPP